MWKDNSNKLILNLKKYILFKLFQAKNKKKRSISKGHVALNTFNAFKKYK